MAQCKECGFKAQQGWKMAMHVRTEHPKRYQCEHCHEKFSRRNALASHVRYKHPKSAAATPEAARTTTITYSVNQNDSLLCKCPKCDALIVVNTAEASPVYIAEQHA